MKKLSLVTKISCILGVLLTFFGVIGFSDYIADGVIDTSDSKSISDEAVEDGDTVTLNFKYAVCESLETQTYEAELIEGTPGKVATVSGNKVYKTSTKDYYAAFFTYLNSIADDSPKIETTIGKGTTTYKGIGDCAGYSVILNVTLAIEHKSTTLFGQKVETWNGTYTLSKKKLDSVSLKYNYYDYAIQERISVGLNTEMTYDSLNEFFSSTYDGNCGFAGLAEETSEGIPSETKISLPFKASESNTYYALFNKTSVDGKYVIGQTISNECTVEGTSYTFNAFSAEDKFNLANDISYSEIDNYVFLGDKTSKIATSEGEEVIGTKISSNVTVNFGLNGGKTYIEGESTKIEDLEPEDSNHSRQYTIFLQSDLYVYGTLVIGANYGTTSNTLYQGHIANEYVTLDLNGHNIYVENGTLIAYGLIKNSKSNGEVIAHGGNIYTLAVIYDYRGGTATLSLVGQKIMPFQVYSLPYLRCKVRLCCFDGEWTKFIAKCSVRTTALTSSMVSIDFIGGANDDALFKLSQKKDSYVEIIGSKNEQVIKDKAETDNETKLCFSHRLRINFYNCSVKMSNIIINPGKEVNTKDYNFPVSSFFDISLINTDLTFSQSLKFMPGSSLIADKDSKIIMSYDSSNSKSAQLSILGENAYYYDSENDTIIKNDLITESQLTYTASFFKSESLWKYYSGSRFKIYGTLVFQGGNSNVRDYLLTGQMDFNRVAYSSDGTTSSLEYIDYSDNENPFAKLMEKHSDVTIKTYGYDYMLGGPNRDAVIKGYSRPLVSYGKGYYTNGSATDAKVGDYNFKTGIFKVSDTEMYYFNIGETFTLEDNSTCTLNACSYNETDHTFTDVSTNTQYAYFAGSYYPYTNTDGTITLNVTRSNSSTTSVTAIFDSTLERWLRK